MKLRRTILIGGLSILLSGLISACGNAKQDNNSSGQNTNNKANTTLTFYNGQHEATTEAVVKAFEKKTGIHIKLRSGSSSELVNQIIEEGKNSPADIIYTEESTPLTLLDEKGLLAKVNDSTLKNIPAKDSSQNGDWVGTTARTRVVAYNPSKVKESELPDSLLGFADPKWKGKIGFVPTSGSFQEQALAIAKSQGKKVALQWLKAMQKNGKVYSDNEVALNAAERGEVAVALVNHYYWYNTRQEKGAANMHTKLYYFNKVDPGNMIAISGVGILKSSSHKKAAQKLLSFMASKEGQEVLKKGSFEYPLNPKVTRNDIKPFSDVLAPDITPKDLGDGQEALKLAQEAGIR